MNNETVKMRTALVTGANRGIGLAIAKGLSACGNIRVIAAARWAEDAQVVAAGIACGTTGVALDLSDPTDVGERASAIEKRYGPIDILVNNAAILIPGSGLEISPADLAKSLAVNTIAPFALIRALGHGMKVRGWGRIVNISSDWGAFSEGINGPAAYSISKAALNAMTLSFAPILGAAVKINAANPGWVRTRMGGQNATYSPEEGADTPIWLATLPDDGPTGGFFCDRRVVAW